MGSFVGNIEVRAQLKSLALENRLHHCLLFEGPSGVGKRTTALWLASLVNCDEQDGPCGSCWSCRQIAKGQHPDVIIVGLDPKKTAAIISVEQARSIVSQLALRPFCAKLRFVIIDPADAMTPEAANAMLKTLEEPPAETGFILVSSAAASLLTTVRSRSQRIRFAPVELGVLEGWLAEQGVEEPAMVARLSSGCPGRAVGLSSSETTAWRAARDTLVDALAGPVDDHFKYAEKLNRGSERAVWVAQVEAMMEALSCMLRDTLAVRSGGEILYNDDRPQLVAEWAERMDAAAVGRLTEDVATARTRLAGFVNGRLLTDSLVSRLAAELRSAR